MTPDRCPGRERPTFAPPHADATHAACLTCSHYAAPAPGIRFRSMYRTEYGSGTVCRAHMPIATDTAPGANPQG
jgi:hypothetical protein